MRISPYRLLVLAFMLGTYVSNAQQKRVVDFTGGARSVMTNDHLSVNDSIADTTSVKRSTGGYAMIDLGVDIRPNSTTEILGMFRIRNQYGGFWGAGVTFDVRQLWLKGIIGNTVRYQVGDLNLKQTRFTLYNHHADRFDSLPDVFSLQSDIVDYERFYTGNTWRQQGANVDFGLQFAKYIEEIDFTGYVVRMNATDFTFTPDRLMAGVSAIVVQQKGLDIGYHNASVFNVKGTAAQSDEFTNTVNAVTAHYLFSRGDMDLDFSGEAGNSRYANSRYADEPALSDYFLYSQASLHWKKTHLNFTAGYLNVGPDFRSIGAQSKDIDYTSLPGYFDRYTNNQTVRPLDLTDLIQNPNLYTTSVSNQLMAINPAINNVSPYGDATFNRLGGFAGLRYEHPHGITLSFKQNALREIRGQGTLALKRFSRTQMNARIDIDRLTGLKRKLCIHAGVDLQNTRRTGTALESIDLKSGRYQAGAELELFKKFDILMGAMRVKTSGNEFLPERNAYTLIDYFDAITYDLVQQSIAAGIRYRFDKKIYLCALYQSSRYNDRFRTNPRYTIDQFALIYNMTF